MSRTARGILVSCLAFAATSIVARPARAQAGWVQFQTMQGRIAASMAYDGARDRLVLFGGQPVAGQQLAETWEFDGTSWHRRTHGPGPVSRSHHTMAYDAARGVVVLFGGRSFASPGGYVADTWEWNGTTWTQRLPLHSPPSRAESVMVWDAANQRVLLFGGYANQGSGFHYYANDLWSWDGVDWTQHTFAGGPSPRSQHAGAYDSLRQRLVVYGGRDANSGLQPLGDTWEWDGATWSQATSPSSPPPLQSATAAFRSSSGGVLLFGGSNMNGFQNGTWEWDGASWSQLTTSVALAARELHTCSYDTLRYEVKVFGGWIAPGLSIQRDLWAFGANGVWNEASLPIGAIPARRWGAMAADDVTGNLVVFGGSTTLQTLGDTWVAYGAGWGQAFPASAPSARSGHAMATDPVTGRPILFGGGWSSGQALGDFWRWTGVTWQNVPQANAPLPRYLHRMCAHPPSQTVLLFGGQMNSTMLGDTWSWDAVTGVWTQLQPALSPSPRGRHGMVYDAARDRIVLYGGFGPLDDTWEWDGTTWLPRVTAVRPPARAFPGMAWDAQRARVVLFGGAPATGSYGDTWEWDGVAWTTAVLVPTPAPSPSPYLAWNEASARVVAVVDTATWEYGTVQPASWSPFGAGCASTVGVPALAPAPYSLPWLGDTMRLRIAPVGSGQSALLVFGTRFQFGSVPLPASLGPYGMPGCTLLVGDQGPLLATTTGSHAEVQAVIPNVPALVGASVDVQAWVTDPFANAVGMVTTNAGSLVARMR
ncbi:MAG: hypothetical protein JNK15_25510 [Planctomycetes bacterium]|nr:hypothetical protein [Planctomycetota bacterium]